MVKTWADDWREPEQVERWVADIVTELQGWATNGTQVEAPSSPPS